jgi:glycosyltransferase involved in cell wall biosynthesis
MPPRNNSSAGGDQSMGASAPGTARADVKDAPHLSVVIPAYRSEDCIRELADRLASAVSKITQNYEILFVEDAGGDHSWNIICELAAHDSRIRGLQFCRNFGQHYALTAGIDHARGDWIVTMDCDLQDPPEAIEKLYEKALQGHDVVLARRIGRDDQKWDALTSILFYRVFDYLTDTQSDPTVGAFRIFSRRVRDTLVGMREQSRFFGGLMHWMGFPTATVDVLRTPRFAGKSTYTFRKRMALALPAIVAFSNKPLYLVVKAGFVIALFAFVAGVVFAVRQLVYKIPVEGWTSVIVSLYFLGGIIISTLGVVGIYVGKTFDQTKGRPLYIVHRSTSDG